MKVCPYCGKRIRYNELFHVKSKGSYECSRCKRESKVKIEMKLILLFIALCLLVALITIIWCVAGLSNNISGVIIVTAIVCAFYFSTPYFLEFVPISKHKNEIGRKKNYEEKQVIENVESDFEFDRTAFDRIKKKKELGMLNLKKDDISSSSKNYRKEEMVPVIEDVKEGHISSSDGPLHKINRTPKKYEHKYEQIFDEISQEEEIKQYIPKKNKRREGSKYTGNRRL